MRSKILVGVGLVLLLFWRVGVKSSTIEGASGKLETQTGTLERMTVTRGTLTMDIDLDLLNGNHPKTIETKREPVSFDIGADSFFTIRLFNNVFRRPDPGSLVLVPSERTLPEPLKSSANQLTLEKVHSGAPFDLVVRDRKSG